MNTTPQQILQVENDKTAIEFRCVRKLAELDELNVVALLKILAPNPSAFDGTWTNGTPTLYGEFVNSDGNRRWDVLRDVDARDALSASVDAGRLQTPVIPNGSTEPIRAIALRYAYDDLVSYFSIDLDGKYPNHEVVRKFADLFGADSILVHSGSGAEGRFRVLGRLAKPMTVEEMQVHLRVIAIAIGFPPKGGHLEISPGNSASRIPFGCGGCHVFSVDLDPVGEPDFDAAVSNFLNLTPIDLSEIIERLGNPGIDTGPRAKFVAGRIDPWTRRERARSRPRRIRRLLAEGITGHGQRNRAIFEFVRDSLYSGYTCAQTIERLIAWIRAGKLDPSRDIQKHGREWQIRQVERIVVRLYSTLAPLGAPDPIPLISEEIREVKRIAKNLAARSRFTRARIERFLLRALPWFKGMRAAGLPMLRMHSKRWEGFDRDYRELRELTGLFRAETGYRALSSVRARRELGARDSEAHARSYSCRFPFALSSSDVPSYVLSTNGSRSVESFDIPLDPPSMFVCTSLGSTSSGASLSSVATPSQPRTQQLYVRHSKSPLKRRGSDRRLREPEDRSESEERTPSNESTTSISSDAPAELHKGAKKSRSGVGLGFDLFAKPKPREWQLLNRWMAPCTNEMELDDWFDTSDAIVDEYKRELRDAKADKRGIERKLGIRVSIGRVASKRFHELREILGLDPWR